MTKRQLRGWAARASASCTASTAADQSEPGDAEAWHCCPTARGWSPSSAITACGAIPLAAVRCRSRGQRISRQPANGGIEAMAALADGRVIAISEEYSRQAGTVVGWISQPTATVADWQSFTYTTFPTSGQPPSPSYPTLIRHHRRAFDYVRGVFIQSCGLRRPSKPGGSAGPRAGPACLSLCGRQSRKAWQRQGPAAKRCCG